jgi:hypothetical protein
LAKDHSAAGHICGKLSDDLLDKFNKYKSAYKLLKRIKKYFAMNAPNSVAVFSEKL